MNSQIVEGLLLGVYGMLLTIFILFLLGLVIYLFKFLNLSSKEEKVEEELEGSGYKETTTINDKKMVAILVALAKYFSEKESQGETKVVQSTNTFLKSIKEKRWKNG
jgi:Na+-transporting methylmalonyl-CoA/oxaloacetate decarboxylase gamma subunit